jgi:serine/threonine protein kinase
MTLRDSTAVKVLDPFLARDDSLRKIFLNEAKAAARLKHPNIVNIYDVGQEGNSLFIVMELLKGQNLYQVVKTEGPLSLDRIVEIVEQIGAALDFAHDHGVVHRDVKSANVIIGEDDHATLTDFGLVKALRDSVHFSDPGRSPARKAGSLAYMAPESIQRGEFTPKSDLYGLGVVLYEIVTGRWPFLGTEFEIQRAHLEQIPPRPTNFRPDLPPAFESVVLQSLAKPPQHRFNDGAHLASTLKWITRPQETREVAATPVPPPPPPVWPARKRKLYRSRSTRVLAGVCGGLAEHYGWDPVAVRLIFTLFVLVSACPALGIGVAFLLDPFLFDEALPLLCLVPPLLLYPLLVLAVPLEPEPGEGT